MKPVPAYSNILLKISGETLAGTKNYRDQNNKYEAFNLAVLQSIAQDIKSCNELGIKLSVVVGGGNIYRGLTGGNQFDMDRVASDHMGMMATVINTLAISQALKNIGLETAIFSAFAIPGIVDCFYKDQARQALKDGKIVLFCGGTGNPYFTTDTAATLRALEMECDLLVKATKVTGVFCSDPEKNTNAQFFQFLTFDEVIKKQLNVMDLTAISLAQENNLPIAVYCMFSQNGLQNVLTNEGEFTLIKAA